MSTDRVVRLDTKTGQMVEYPLPRETTSGRVFVDESRIPAALGRQQPRRFDRQGGTA